MKKVQSVNPLLRVICYSTLPLKRDYLQMFERGENHFKYEGQKVQLPSLHLFLIFMCLLMVHLCEPHYDNIMQFFKQLFILTAIMLLAIPLLTLGFVILGILLIMMPFVMWYIKWRFFRTTMDHMDEMRERTKHATTTLVQDEDGNVSEAEVLVSKPAKPFKSRKKK